MDLVSETFIARHRHDLLPGRTFNFALDEENRRPLDPTEMVATWERFPPGANLLSGALRGEPAWMGRFINRLKHVRSEVVLGEYLHLTWGIFRHLYRMPLRLYAHAHGYDISIKLREPLWRARYRELSKWAVIVTISQHSKRLLIEAGIDADRIEVIPYGPQAGPPRVERGDGLVRCLAVGRMVPKKAPAITVEAFARARQQQPALRLTVVGDGPLKPDVMQVAERLGVGEAIEFHGALPHARVLELMRQHDIFLQHSIVDPVSGDTEGLPVAILEAMAHALPVISTRHTGIPEAVVEGETGLLVNEGDVAAMASQIAALASDQNTRDRMGLAARARIDSHFSWEQEKRRLLTLMFPNGLSG
jgi:glycosyltransferase involved in cell wall biosynthesis